MAARNQQPLSGRSSDVDLVASVLVVDDHRPNVLALEALLEPLRLNVVGAGSGEEALRTLDGTDFAVILLDVRMPGLDGFETARRIKAHERARSTPILFVTANDGSRDEIRQAYAHGAADYLTKPFEADVIRAKIGVFVELYRKTEQLRRQEHFRVLAEAIPQLVWTAHADGTLEYRNHAWVDYVGRDLSDTSDADRASLMHADDAAVTTERWQRAKESGEPFETMYRLRRHDGAYRWFLARAEALRDASGRVVKWFGTCTDIDAQKRAEEERTLLAEKLAAERALLQAILESATSAIYLKDLEGRHLLVNRRYEEITGRSRAELEGQPDEQIVGKDVARGFREADKKVASTGEPLHLEHTFVNRGEERTYLTVKFPVRDATGTVYAIGGMWTDITDRRRAEDRLRFLSEASKALASSLDVKATLRTIAAFAVPRLGDWCAVEMNLPDGKSDQIAVAHVDPKKVEFAWELRRRYPPNPDAPMGVPAVLRGGKSELYPEISEEMLVQGAVDAEHLRISRELGLKSALVVPIRAADTTHGAFTLVSAESGRVYNALDLALAEELGARAGLAMDNARLYEEAQQAIRVRDDFLSVASHELKTPLTSMRLQLTTVARSAQKTAPALVETVQRAQHGLDRLARLVEELLDVSRITAGRLVLTRAPVDLPALVQEVVTNLGEEWQRAGCEVRFTAEGDGHGSWDASRLEQIVTNLIVNACKFGKGHPVDVAVVGTGPTVLLRVADHGIGISPDDQRRIFDRFERAVSSRHYGGLGLGLWISRQIVEAHGGSISVSSGVGQGATFEVTLPRS